MKKTKGILALLALVFGAFAQDTEQESTKKAKDLPVAAAFESSFLIDNQTWVIPAKKTLTYTIQHKFGSMDNGISDLFGIYSPGANVRLGLFYVPWKNVQVGYGITKKNKYSDFNMKWTILEQTRKNRVPVSVMLYGNFAIDGRNNSTFGEYYDIEDRFSYFSQLLIGRKFNNWLTLQAGASFTHFNTIEPGGDHDKIGAHVNGRLKFSPQSSLIFTYDVPLKWNKISEQYRPSKNTSIDYPEPDLAIGWEISTGTHAFQIYAGSSYGILPQDVMISNQNKWYKGKMALGFTITRLWYF
jgi:hypothetical protein